PWLLQRQHAHGARRHPHLQRAALDLEHGLVEHVDGLGRRGADVDVGHHVSLARVDEEDDAGGAGGVFVDGGGGAGGGAGRGGGGCRGSMRGVGGVMRASSAPRLIASTAWSSKSTAGAVGEPRWTWATTSPSLGLMRKTTRGVPEASSWTVAKTPSGSQAQVG